jgi:hypothetical protein
VPVFGPVSMPPSRCVQTGGNGPLHTISTRDKQWTKMIKKEIVTSRPAITSFNAAWQATAASKTAPLLVAAPPLVVATAPLSAGVIGGCVGIVRSDQECVSSFLPHEHITPQTVMSDYTDVGCQQLQQQQQQQQQQHNHYHHIPPPTPRPQPPRGIWQHLRERTLLLHGKSE